MYTRTKFSIPLAAALVASAASILFSCGKTPEVILSAPSRSEVSFRITSAHQAPVRSTVGADEEAVNGFQILVFNPDGRLDAYGSTTGATDSVKVKITRGSVKTCYAVVNSSADLSGVSTLAALRARTSWLRDNSATGLEMIGCVEGDIAQSPVCEVAVSRFAARVRVDRVTPAFASAAHRAMPFRVEAIYLINAQGRCRYDLTPGDSLWYNPQKYVTGECDSFLADKGIGATVTAQKPYATPHTFYCYPNPTKADAQGGKDFSPRLTRLVVETTLGDQTLYYPVTVTGEDGTLDANTSYEITDLRITGLGSTDPDVVPQKDSLTFKITVTPWQVGFSRDVEI